MKTFHFHLGIIFVPFLVVVKTQVGTYESKFLGALDENVAIVTCAKGL